MLLKLLHIMALPMLMSCTKSTTAEVQAIDSPVETLPASPVVERIVSVKNTTELKAALENAKPGDLIKLADGEYNGKFIIATDKNGTKEKPIQLVGSRQAILNAGSTQTGYVLHLQANHWIIKGITITNGLKGIMTDGASYNLIDSVKVYQIGEEAIHLRRFSSHNTIQHTEISNVGLKTPSYGEGIYIGSAKNNWANYTNGLPDNCDSNKVLNNHIGPGVTAEAIDIKEGTTGGIIRGNYFDATGITGANGGDSWIDVKGNSYLIENNKGFNPGEAAFVDGYQVHVAVNGWGNYNVFKNNTCTVNSTGYGFNIQLSGSNGTSTGNRVYNNNIVNGAQKGIANIAVTN